MNILIIDNGSRNLETLLSRLSRHHVSIISFSEFDFSAPTEGGSDVLLLPGASQYALISNTVRFTKELTYLRNTSMPIIGICFGAELLATAHNGSISMLNQKISGKRTISIDATAHPLFRGHHSLEVVESHRFAITSLPTTLTPLAHSNSGIELFEHHSKPHVGMQFHPESLTHTESGSWFLDAALEYVITKKAP